MKSDSPLSNRQLVGHLRVHTAAVDETQQIGRQLGQQAGAGQVIALRGDLGAGKTTFAQGLAAGLGIAARITSPTFTLVNEYSPGARGLALVHIDAYRLAEAPQAAAQEATTFGLEEILAESEETGAVVVIEWAERVADLLPDDRLAIELSYEPGQPDGRILALSAGGPRSATLLRALQNHIAPGPD